MKTIDVVLLTIAGTLGVLALGLLAANEIVDYIQYQQVLKIKEALIAL